ncbi:O-antigen ligase domain-containing protein [Pseudonocardia hispaniensis]|uniref:O-antigen ligase domain-containing protein n=1 Tax=Pseudonocardia hispaniensis TaxID=904933 RepID=A0ABW1J798_9PSEU
MLTGPDRAGQVRIASARPPRLLGVIWALLLLDTLGYTAVDLIIPFPRQLAQVITMAALGLAFGLAVTLNPRGLVRPNAYLLLVSLLTIVALASSLLLTAGLGALLRCARLVLFVATLWLTTAWWRGDLYVARLHLRTVCVVLLTVLAGLVISPGSAFSGPNGRLVGAIWPIQPPQVGMYAATAIGLAVLLRLTRNIDWRSTVVITVPATVLLLLSHTRTALLGLLVALGVAGLTLALTYGRVRRAIGTAAALAVVGAGLFSESIMVWLQRGQDAEELANLTGRQKVWDLLLGADRSLGEEIMGVGLTDKSFAGLPIDNTWLAVYHEQGLLGVGLVAAIMVGLLAIAALRPPSAQRACAVFLVGYCIIASYTEVTLGDASPYVLNLAVAAALLVAPGPAAVAPGGLSRKALG